MPVQDSTTTNANIITLPETKAAYSVSLDESLLSTNNAAITGTAGLGLLSRLCSKEESSNGTSENELSFSRLPSIKSMLNTEEQLINSNSNSSSPDNSESTATTNDTKLLQLVADEITPPPTPCHLLQQLLHEYPDGIIPVSQQQQEIRQQQDQEFKEQETVSSPQRRHTFSHPIFYNQDNSGVNSGVNNFMAEYHAFLLSHGFQLHPPNPAVPNNPVTNNTGPINGNYLYDSFNSSSVSSSLFNQNLQLINNHQQIYNQPIATNTIPSLNPNQQPSADPARKHQCPIEGCLKSFKRNEHLRRHVLTHTKVKNYHCTFVGCNKSFARSDNLSQHMVSFLNFLNFLEDALQEEGIKRE